MHPSALPLILALLLLLGCGASQRVETRPDGSIKASGPTSGGFLHGEWSWFHPGGQLQARGGYVRDKQQGLWVWWDEQGRELQRGAYAMGLREGWWVYRHPGGRIKAVGAYRADRQDGLWRYLDADGRLSAQGSFDRGAREGLWQFVSADGQRESGCYLGGRRVGPWLSEGPGGMALSIHGVPEGWSLRTRQQEGEPASWVLDGPEGRRLAVSWEPQLVVDRQGAALAIVAESADGTVLSGRLDPAQPEQRWLRLRSDGSAETLAVWPGGARVEAPLAPGLEPGPDAGALPDAGAPSGPQDALADAVAEIQAAARELLARVDTGAYAAPPSGPAPAPAPAPAAVELSPTVAAPEMTPMDQRKAAFSERVYREGLSFETGSDYGGPSADEGPSRLRQDLIGQPLAPTRFLDGSGTVVDLADHRGQRNVVLVVLRGFAGSICPYCSGQTRALISRAEDFRTRGAEVLLCYPGAASAVPQFVAAVTGASDGTLPLGLLLDLDLGFVRATSIERDLAAPTTFIVDREGIVRYCYQGLDLTDRPSVPELLRELDRIEAEP